MFGDQRQRATARAVGVELAAGAVRAAYVDGDRLEVGEAPLPDGAIVGGEILDEHSVAEALRRLWAEHRFPTKAVVLGIASPDIVTRPVSLPPMNAKDTRSALPFELADMVPFPIGDAVIDALPLDGYPTYEPVAPANEVHLLAVVAQQSTLRRVASVATRAGLSVVTVEPPAFALVRAAGRNDVLSHAVVDFGADTLVVAVHRCGILQFYRNVVTRQSEFESSSELEAELVFIEQFRRRAAGAEEMSVGAEIRDHPLVAAIRGTLEYAAAQPGSISVDAVTLAGEYERCEQIAPALGGSLTIPLHVIDPVARAGLPVPTLGRGSVFTTAIGLSLVPDASTPGPRRLDLLPRSESAESSPRRLAIRVGLASIATASLLAGVTMALGPDTGTATENLASAHGAANDVDAQLQTLAEPIADVRETAALGRSLDKVDALGVDWGRLAQEIRLAAPPEVQVVAIDAKGPDPRRRSSDAGLIEVRGQAPNQTAITAWLGALAGIDGLKDPWLEGASTGGDRSGAADGFTAFTLTMSLTERSDR